MGLPVVARIAGNEEWLTVAETRANAVLSASFGLYSTTMARVGLALIAVERGNVAAAEEQYAALVSVPGIMVFYIGTDQVLGLLSVTLGRLDQAVAHFEDSLEFCRKAGYRPNLAWTCYDYADTLLQRASTSSTRTDDRQKAVSLLDESLSISTELGMRPLMERTQDRLDRIGSTAPETPDYPSGLSQREVEVLRLLALGKSNREIGDELVITEGTVRRQVSNVYQKIRASNRSEATSYALREGLAGRVAGHLQ